MENQIESRTKQSGESRWRRHLRNGSLVTVAAETVLLGRSKTSKEIKQLSSHLKTMQKLQKNYMDRLREFDKQYDRELVHESCDKVWICWFQGLDQAPFIVKKCIESLKRHMPQKEIVVITSETMPDYVQFPDNILDKWKSGQISYAHMSDLLRLELLIHYGGMWVDATVFCSDFDIPDYFFNSELFFFQCLRPGQEGHSYLISNWLISAKSNNRILMATRQLLYEYWKKNDAAIDYFLFHAFVSMVLAFYEEDWKAIVPRDNATPHELQFRLFDPFDERIWNAIKEQTPFHKLTYKIGSEEEEKEHTFFSELLQSEKGME